MNATVEVLVKVDVFGDGKVQQVNHLLVTESIADSDYRNERAIADALERLAERIRKGAIFRAEFVEAANEDPGSGAP